MLDIRNLLTYCCRGERLVSGHWNSMLNRGIIFSIFERLKVLQEE